MLGFFILWSGVILMVNNNSTQQKKKAFLELYPECFTVMETCKRINIERSTFYDWLKSDDADFKAKFEIAKQEAVQYLEAEAWKRATRPTNPSDTLLIFLMKGADPNRYRDNARVEVNGKTELVISYGKPEENNNMSTSSKDEQSQK